MQRINFLFVVLFPLFSCRAIKALSAIVPIQKRREEKGRSEQAFENRDASYAAKRILGLGREVAVSGISAALVAVPGYHERVVDHYKNSPVTPIVSTITIRLWGRGWSVLRPAAML